MSEKNRVGRPLKVDQEVSNLVSAWKQLSTQDKTLTQALNEMNKAIGTKTTHSRINEWEEGRRKPSSSAINYMNQLVIKKLLSRLEIDSKEIEKLLAQIKIP